MRSLRSNAFKQALAARTQQIGLWLGLCDSYSAEICAGAGFDWLVIDGEHAPNDVRTTLAQLQAIAAYPAHGVVRPLVGETNRIKQLLDIGAQTLLVPMVESAEQAEALVRDMQYPPKGIRGVGSALARASEWSRVPGYVHKAGEELCLIVQVETVKGLEALGEIAAVQGVDGVFIGPADLSASLGYLGNPEAPAVKAEIDHAISMIHEMGKPSGILATGESSARYYLDLGCTFVAVGIDTALLAQATAVLAAKFRGA